MWMVCPCCEILSIFGWYLSASHIYRELKIGWNHPCLDDLYHPNLDDFCKSSESGCFVSSYFGWFWRCLQVIQMWWMFCTTHVFFNLVNSQGLTTRKRKIERKRRTASYGERTQTCTIENHTNFFTLANWPLYTQKNGFDGATKCKGGPFLDFAQVTSAVIVLENIMPELARTKTWLHVLIDMQLRAWAHRQSAYAQLSPLYLLSTLCITSANQVFRIWSGDCTLNRLMEVCIKLLSTLLKYICMHALLKQSGCFNRRVVTLVVDKPDIFCWLHKTTGEKALQTILQPASCS